MQLRVVMTITQCVFVPNAAHRVYFSCTRALRRQRQAHAITLSSRRTGTKVYVQLVILGDGTNSRCSRPFKGLKRIVDVNHQYLS